MSDMAETVARAAMSAIADVMPLVEQDRRAVRYLTVEVELNNGMPIDARAWVERRCNIGKALGVGRG